MPAGTIAFYFEGDKRIAEYGLTGSGVITPVIGSWESTTVSGNIFAKCNTASSGVDGVFVNLTGFEFPQV